MRAVRGAAPFPTPPASIRKEALTEGFLIEFNPQRASWLSIRAKALSMVLLPVDLRFFKLTPLLLEVRFWLCFCMSVCFVWDQ